MNFGFIVGTDEPWIVKEPVFSNPIERKKTDHRIRAFHLKMNKLKLFKGVCFLGTGKVIVAPRTKKIKIERTEFGHTLLVTWELETVLITQDISITHIGLIDDLGVLVIKKEMKAHYNSEDKLTIGDLSLTLEY